MSLVQSAEPEDMYTLASLLISIISPIDNAKVIVDPSSMEFVKDATLDYVEELIGSSFQITANPHADSRYNTTILAITSCGCKVSFNLK